MRFLLSVCMLGCIVPSAAFAGEWDAPQRAVFSAEEVHIEYRSGSTRVVVDHIKDQGQRVVTYISGKRYRTGYIFWTKSLDGSPGEIYASWSRLHQFEDCSRLSSFGNMWDPRSAPYMLMMSDNERLFRQPPVIRRTSIRHDGARSFLTAKRRIGSARTQARLILQRRSERPLVARTQLKDQNGTIRSTTRFSYNVRGALSAPQNKC